MQQCVTAKDCGSGSSFKPPSRKRKPISYDQRRSSKRTNAQTQKLPNSATIARSVECNLAESRRRFNQLQDEIIYDTRTFVRTCNGGSARSSTLVDTTSAGTANAPIYSPFRPTSDDEKKYTDYVTNYFSPFRSPTPFKWHPCHPIRVPNPPPALLHSLTVYEPFVQQFHCDNLSHISDDHSAVSTYLSLPLLPVEEYPISYLSTVSFIVDLYCLLSCRKYTVKKASRYSASWTCNGCNEKSCPFSVHIVIGKNEIKWNRNKSWVFHNESCQNVCSWSSTCDPPPPPERSLVDSSATCSNSSYSTCDRDENYRELLERRSDNQEPIASNTVLFALSVVCISRYLPVHDVFIKKKEQTSNWRSPWNLQRNKILDFLKSKLGLNISLTTNKFWAAMKDVLNGHITYFFDTKNAAKVSIFGLAHYYKNYKEHSILRLDETNNGFLETCFPQVKSNLTCSTCLQRVHPRYVIFLNHSDGDPTCFQCAGCYANNYYCRQLFFVPASTDTDDSDIAYSETVSSAACKVCDKSFSLREELSFQNHDHPVWNVHPYQDSQLPSITFSVPYAWIRSVPIFFPSITSHVQSNAEQRTSILLNYTNRFANR